MECSPLYLMGMISAQSKTTNTQSKTAKCRQIGKVSTNTQSKTTKCRQIGKVSTAVVLTENVQVHRDQQAFFSNESNKTQLFSLLAKHLQTIGHRVQISNGDADTSIVSRALEFRVAIWYFSIPD